MQVILTIMFIVSFFLAGCETVHQGAQEVGKPIGETFKAVGGVTEGAASGYADDEGPNPYNR